MGKKKSIKEKDLLAAIEGSRGIISTVAARLHVGWHTVERALQKSEKAREAMSDEEETTLDFVEGKAIQRINDGDGAMIRFYLATKGKKRGFTYDATAARENEESADNEIRITIDESEQQETVCADL